MIIDYEEIIDPFPSSFDPEKQISGFYVTNVNGLQLTLTVISKARKFFVNHL